ncbi:hypothetical protein [Corynebacterium kroppenstedtii]|uniref:hypothetical protein n=1 Tax=Corynebacterium kroppenstedtii TaxID=161879 RepID=UPI001D1DE9CE|nr:hypothetical protein [uncultured Corynebacterium sp.]HJD68483.1 hypothetical protein [Corynebacterium kroppenstedtii]
MTSHPVLGRHRAGSVRHRFSIGAVSIAQPRRGKHSSVPSSHILAVSISAH